MSYGTQLILTENVVPNIPLPVHEKLAIEMYANALKEIYMSKPSNPRPSSPGQSKPAQGQPPKK